MPQMRKRSVAGSGISLLQPRRAHSTWLSKRPSSLSVADVLVPDRWEKGN